jgi:3-oxoacyl-[acyl-carrier protein] reductase
MMITATPARMAFPLVGGFSVACAAMEGFSRSLAAELGPHGVRGYCQVNRVACTVSAQCGILTA